MSKIHNLAALANCAGPRGKYTTEFLVSVFADDFINISAGEIAHPTHEENRMRLQAYFDRSEFLE